MPGIRGGWAIGVLVLLAGCSGWSAEGPRVVRIEPGREAQERVQTALIQARPGEVIELAAGRFDFTGTLSLDVDNVVLRGAGPDKTILSFSRQGQGTGGEGLLVTSDHFTLEDLGIEDVRGDAVKVNGTTGVTIRRVRVEWTGGPKATNGSYGLYPVLCRNVLIEDCVAIGASDAGIYVGQSENIVVRRNRAEYNVAGIEIENSLRADVFDNHLTNNASGILVFTLPDLPKKVGRHCRVFRNRIVANNHANFAPAGNIVATVPAGTGLMVMAYDQVELFENRLENNQTVNLAVVSYLATQRKIEDPQYDPYAEGIHIHHNTFSGGGDKPSGPLGTVLKQVLGGALPDIIYDGAVNPTRLVAGELPPELKLYIHDNGDADFANVDIENLGTSLVASLVLPKKSPVNRDLGAHQGRLPPLEPVRIAGVE